MEASVDLAPKFQEPCTCDGPGPEGQHRWWCGDKEAEEAAHFVEPTTVGGLTGAQWSQLRLWEDENRCDFDDELNNRCPDDRVNGSRFCSFHERIEETYDEYDSWRDRAYEE